MASETFTTDTNWTVPDSVEEVLLRPKGESGQDGESDSASGGAGGGGHKVEGKLAVQPGETLYIRFGGGGIGGASSGGTAGGDGGDAADVRYGGTTLSDRIIVGGGGGGGGGAATSEDISGGPGGAGGLPEGEDGSGSFGGGGGGTQTSGGSGSGGDGSFGLGGDGEDAADDSPAGGAGGAGWYGGAGGYATSTSNDAGGGGGGSSYLDDSLTSTADLGTTSSGREVVIEYTTQADTPNNVEINRAGLEANEITWDEPDNLTYVDGYEIERSVSGGAWETVTTATSGTSYTDTGRAQETNHQYRVRSNGSDGSLDSDWVETGTKSTGGSPSGTTVANPTKDSLELSWTNPPGDWETIEIYRARSSSTSLSDYTLVNTDTSGSWVDTGLTNGRTYHYRLVAVYFDADSAPTADENETTLLPAPTLDSVTAGYREVVIAWTLNDDNPDGAVVIYRDGADVGSVSDLSTTSYTDTGLLDGEEYSYTIERDTGDATASSGAASDITDLPAPTNLAVDAVSATSADLSWTDNHNNGDTRVEYKTSDVSSWTTFSTIARKINAETVTGLLNGEQYDARVVAQTDHASTVDQ